MIVPTARSVCTRLYTEGHAFLKAGIGLIEIVDRAHYQFDLLHKGQPKQADDLMQAIDQVNKKYGRGTLHIAAQGTSKPWYIRQQYTSPQYTTKWSDLPRVCA